MNTPTHKQMSASATTTMMEVINILNNHQSEVLINVLNILSERYGHSIDDMTECIRTHQDFHAIKIHPILTTQFFQSAIEVEKQTKVVAVKPLKKTKKPIPLVIPEIVPEVVPEPIHEVVTPPRRVVKIKRKVVEPLEPQLIADTKEILPHSY